MAGQNPIGFGVQQAGSTAQGPFMADGPTALSKSGGIPTAGISGNNSALGITTATVVKAAPGRFIRVAVIVAGSAPGSINDCLTTGAVAVANQIGVAPNAVGVQSFEWPCLVGITVTPGTGQTLSVSFS